MKIIRQFVPEDVCLKCQGCCRFKEADSVWSPCLLDEEVQSFLDKDMPPAYISANRRMMLKQDPITQGYVCPCLDIKNNKCQVYLTRPFECQLYPFLLNLRSGKVLLTVDLNCPYAKEKINSDEFRQYIAYLTQLLNTPAYKRILKDNPQIIQAYEEVTELIELDPGNEPK